jgi:hypothetical protein
MCGTPVPDTGVRSAGGVGGNPDEPPDFPPAAWKQHGKCPSCRRLLVRNVETPEAPQLEQWRLPRPLLSFGGTATIRATPTPMASGGVVHEGTAHLSGGGTLSASGSIHPGTVHGEVGVGRVEWDIGCTSMGMGIGGAAFGKGGALIGGVAGYVWGRRRWPSED